MAEHYRIPEIELNRDGRHGSGSGTIAYYKVEVRTSYYQPTVLGEGKNRFVIDNCWREWSIRPGSTIYGTNVPYGRQFNHGADDLGLFSYVVAEAHRLALLAHLEAAEIMGSLCIETRLVKVEYKYSFEAKEIGVTPVLRADCRERQFAPRPVDPLSPDQPHKEAT